MGAAMSERRSVQPEWALDLPIQQQSVLFLAARGPDGVAKDHPCKAVVRAYRGTVLVAARYGRLLQWGEAADSFMGLDEIVTLRWNPVVRTYFQHVDCLPHHYHMHLMHGAQIIGYKHPDPKFRWAWQMFYTRSCEDLHLIPESEVEMDARLSDWDRVSWDEPERPVQREFQALWNVQSNSPR